MMNLVDLQDKLRNLSQEQLVQQMRAPTGDVPQFLLLSEITRRKKMRDSFAQEQDKDESTVAQDAVAAAGMPAGFAAQMAGAMAPQTDVQGNTGAMPQAQMTQQGAAPVQGMADGGIVALRDGGRPSSQPSTFVRNGMVYIVNERGEEIPWAPASEVSGLNMPAAPRLPVSMPANPSYTEDRSPRSAIATAREPSAPFDPTLGGVSPAMPTPVNPAIAPEVAGVSSAPTVPSLMDDRMAISPVAVPPESASVGQTQAPFPPNMTPAEAQAYSQSAGSTGILGTARNLAEGAVDYGITLPGAYMTERLGNTLSALGLPGLGAKQLQTAEGARDRIALREEERDARAKGRAADANFIDFMGDPTREGAASILPGAELAAAADPESTGDTAVTAEDIVDATPTIRDPATADLSGGAPRGPSGGGIAGLAGAAQTAPSTYEQELLDMLGAREKRAQQDKWLALAQFGLQLMSSKEPTIGGAIGEAGAPALDALRSSRETYDADRLSLLNTLEQYRSGQAQLALRQQAARARSAAGAGGGFKPLPATYLSGLSDRLASEEEAFAALPPIPEPGLFSTPVDPVADERVRRERNIQNLKRQLNFAYSSYGNKPFVDDGRGIPNLSD